MTKPTLNGPEHSFNYRTLPALAAYIDRIGAEELNFRRFMVKERKAHYYLEKSLIKLDNDGSITCSTVAHRPTKEEADAIKEEIKKVIDKWPKTIGATNLKKLTKARGKLYTFWDQQRKHIIMVQERVETQDGKYYVPWCFFSDGEWRSMEPDGKLPFWKPEVTRNKANIMVHEGAKAAAFIDGLINDPKRKKEKEAYPWSKELEEYEHWGMIGGALAPHRTDYNELITEKPMEVVYVCDNDYNGTSALQEVSKWYGRPLRGIKFGKKFRYAWDMADEFPKDLFAGDRYVGPTLASMKEPATYATESLPVETKGGRPTIIIKKWFAEEWVHSVKPDCYIHCDWPNRIYSPQEFDDLVAPFSQTDTTSRLMKKNNAIKAGIIRYDPSIDPGMYAGDESGIFVNTHTKSNIKPEKGDPAPFLDFMEHLCPVEKDRIELMRWCATLMACPEIKMMYALLLISETQGVGKSTLGEHILGPIIGKENTSYPSESEIVDSNFNSWLAHKRLAVVNEIYAGHSSKAYNKLKDTITGRRVNINQKYMASYSIDNWIHILACSNNFNALRMTGDDRRWFIPKITESKKPASYWGKFHEWLDYEGGLQIVAHWAREFVEKNGSVMRGDAAPWSAAKANVIEESWSPGMALCAGILERIKFESGIGEKFERCIILDQDFIILIKNEIYDRRQNDYLERPSTIRKLAKSMGWYIHEDKTRLKDGTQGRLICSDAEDAQRPCNELFQEIGPTRVWRLDKQKLEVDENGAWGVSREELDDPVTQRRQAAE
jgi:uncharacterized protein DUF5906